MERKEVSIFWHNHCKIRGQQCNIVLFERDFIRNQVPAAFVAG
jgi:hypothetical protein